MKKNGGREGEKGEESKERCGYKGKKGECLIAVNCIEEKKIYEFTNIKCVNYTRRYSASIIRAPLSTSWPSCTEQLNLEPELCLFSDSNRSGHVLWSALCSLRVYSLDAEEAAVMFKKQLVWDINHSIEVKSLDLGRSDFISHSCFLFAKMFLVARSECVYACVCLCLDHTMLWSKWLHTV